MTSQPRQEFASRVAIVIALVALTCLFWTWRHVLLLVFAAILVALALRGMSEALARIAPFAEKVALAVVVLLIVMALSLLTWLLGAQIGEQVVSLADSLPDAWDSFTQMLSSLPLGSQLAAEIEDIASNVTGAPILGGLAGLGSWSASLASGLIDAIVVITAAVFMAVSPNAYRNGLLALSPARRRNDIAACLDQSAEGLRRWLVGSLVSMTVMGLAVGLSLFVLRVPAHLALGLLAGLAQFVPLVGPIIAAAPILLLSLAVGLDTGLYALIAYTAASQIEASLLYPLIQKRAISIPPALTLFSIIAFGSLLGPLGALLAVPLTVVLKVFITRLYIERHNHQHMQA